jgi:hypothetical protein
MNMKYTGSDGELHEMEQIPNDLISEFTFKRHLNKGHEISLLLKKYKAAGREILLSNITLEKKSNLREVEGTFICDLMFEYHEHQYLEPFGRVINLNGLKMIETSVTFTKDDIMAAGVIPH